MQMLTHDNEAVGCSKVTRDHCLTLHRKRVPQLTQKDLHGALAHVVVTVKSFSLQIAHLLADMSAVVVEQLDEALEHVEMECWRDELSMRSPFVTLKISEYLISFATTLAGEFKVSQVLSFFGRKAIKSLKGLSLRDRHNKQSQSAHHHRNVFSACRE